jgi:hypothetical protein
MARIFSLHPSLEGRNYLWQENDNQPLSSQHWISFFAFLERRWFRRAWIIQEIAFAKVGIVICGQVLLNWDMLQIAAAWLYESGSHSVIWQQGNSRSSSVMSEYTGLYCAEEDTDVQLRHQNPIVTIAFISRIRQFNKVKASRPAIVSSAEPNDTLAILSDFRSSHCQDPRDKVYAFLSLCSTTDGDLCNKSISVDYSSSVSQIYTDAAWTILENFENLRILSYVDSDEKGRFIDLPSWVPNWSTGQNHIPYETLPWAEGTSSKQSPAHPYTACGKTFWKLDKDHERSQYLNLKGVNIGSIKNMISFEFHNSDVMDILQDIPAVYSYLDLSMTGTHEYISKTNLQDAAKKRVQTRLEAFWRTLICDIWESKHPAPHSAGHAFVDMLANDMRLYLNDGIIFGFDEESKKDEDTGKLIISFIRLAREGILDKTSWQEGFERRVALCLDLRNDEMLSLQGFSQFNISTSNTPVLDVYLQHIKTAKDVHTRNIKDEQAVLAWIKQYREEKLLFTTTTQKIGQGPKSMKLNDEVWILRGAQVPFVLRPMGNGHHRLIGEAYIHGVMHGEVAFQFDESFWCEVILE